MKQVALAEVKDRLSRYLSEAGQETIVITKHGRPAGVLIGFSTEEDWFDYRLENDPRFAERIAAARASLERGKGIAWEDIKAADDQRKVRAGRAKLRRPCRAIPTRCIKAAASL